MAPQVIRKAGAVCGLTDSHGWGGKHGRARIDMDGGGVWLWGLVVE